MKLIPNLTHIVVLNLSMTETIDQVLELIGLNCPEIRELDVSHTAISERGLPRLCYDEATERPLCQKLTKICVLGCVHHPAAGELPAAKLTKICVLGCVITPRPVSFLLQYIPTLREMDYDNVSSPICVLGCVITPRPVSFLLQYIPTLREMDYDNLPPSPSATFPFLPFLLSAHPAITLAAHTFPKIKIVQSRLQLRRENPMTSFFRPRELRHFPPFRPKFGAAAIAIMAATRTQDNSCLRGGESAKNSWSRVIKKEDNLDCFWGVLIACYWVYGVFNVMKEWGLTPANIGTCEKLHLRVLTSTNEVVDPEDVDTAIELCPYATNFTLSNAYVDNDVLYKVMRMENLTHLRITNSEGLTLDFHEGVLPVLTVKGHQLHSLLLVNFTTVDVAGESGVTEGWGGGRGGGGVGGGVGGR
ncbi:hypothetical protein C7M84_024818 [Penaeus vannamei]|uniref:Uncharacterized protein n=1 Tax=Penaeus vannamei TaxID=6689 RepID=A0A3R7PZG3_PENVA|nr:hypothetical protein C7M84_024818 [Penaeus vannamei]